MIKWKFADSDAPGTKISLAGHGIRVVSKPLIHVETEFVEREESFSSQFKIGPRFAKIKYSHPERWKELIMDHLTPQQEDRMYRKAMIWVELRLAGLSKYDTKGAIGCGITGAENPWDPFCSEVTYDIYPDELKLSCINYKMFPQRLYTVGKILKHIHGIQF